MYWNIRYPDCVRNIQSCSEWAWLYASGYPLKCIAPLFPIGTRNLHSSPCNYYGLLPEAMSIVLCSRNAYSNSFQGLKRLTRPINIPRRRCLQELPGHQSIVSPLLLTSSCLSCRKSGLHPWPLCEVALLWKKNLVKPKNLFPAHIRVCLNTANHRKSPQNTANHRKSDRKSGSRNVEHAASDRKSV